MAGELVPLPNVELVRASGVPELLQQVRPAWQARNLIDRVRKLIDVDPSSACQRLLNAAIHDLKEKVQIAGLDIAAEAAKQHSLPQVGKAEDIENYSTSRLIDLVYRMGLLSRPEWRRVHRCYEIRRDLEHEDDEYEAGPEDCFYIFKTCIEVVLSRDPIYVIRVADLRDLVQQATPIVPAADLLQSYGQAPQPRQEEICKFLVSIALDKTQSDLVQQNAFACLSAVASLTQTAVKLVLAAHLQERVKKGAPLDRRLARVANAAGVFPYLRTSQREDFFRSVLDEMQRASYHWTGHTQHGELLRGFAELGGLTNCPEPVRLPILKWLALLYIGEPGGRTSWGNTRNVFYSNIGAPMVLDLIRDAKALVAEELVSLKKDRDIAPRLGNQHVGRRFEDLVDAVES